MNIRGKNRNGRLGQHSANSPGGSPPVIDDVDTPYDAVTIMFFRTLYAPFIRTGKEGCLLYGTLPADKVGSWKNEEPVHRISTLDDLIAASEHAQRLRTAGLNTYFTPNLRAEKPPPGKRGDNQSILCLNSIQFEVDIGKPDSPRTGEEAYEFVASLLTPSIVVWSGGGIHSYYVFDEPVFGTPDELKVITDKFRAYVVSRAGRRKWKLDAVSDPARSMRVPGTVNLKDSSNPRFVSAHYPLEVK